MRQTEHLTVAYKPFRYSTLHYSHVNYLLMLFLVPSVVQATHFYGFFAVRVVASSIAFCMMADALLGTLFKKRTSVFDGSAALTGMLLGMLFPPCTPWWCIFVASFASLGIGKHFFAGEGTSPFNAICIGWAVVMLSWPKLVDPTYGSVGFSLPFSVEYPLALLNSKGAAALGLFPLKQLLLGNQAGCCGAGASFFIICAGVIGIVMGLIPWRIPVGVVSGIIVTSVGCKIAGLPAAGTPFFHLLTGFSLVGAFFVANDMQSRPIVPRYMIGYGIAIGVLTVLFRMWSSFPEGFPFAVLIVNLFVPLFDRGKKIELPYFPGGATAKNEMLGMFYTLSGTAAVCGILLAGVNSITEQMIADQQTKSLPDAVVRNLMTGVTYNPLTDRRECVIDTNKVTLYLGRKDSTITKIAVGTNVKGYSGSVGVLTVFSCSTATIETLAVVRSRETPEIGSKVNDKAFLGQFLHLDTVTVAAIKKDGGSIDAVSGATISSRAVCKAVADAQKSFRHHPALDSGGVKK